MKAELLTLRLIHILGGIFWVGSMVFTTFFLAPVLRSSPAMAGQVMAGLQKRRLGGAACTGMTLWATVVGRPHRLSHFRVPIITALLAVLEHTLTTEESF